MDQAGLNPTKAQPASGRAWAVVFFTRARFGPFIQARLKDEPGLNSMVESLKLGLAEYKIITRDWNTSRFTYA